MTYRAWLNAQRRRNDPIGDLARDVHEDRALKGRRLGHVWFMSYLKSCGACDGALRAAKQAAAEWKLAAGGSDVR